MPEVSGHSRHSSRLGADRRIRAVTDSENANKTGFAAATAIAAPSPMTNVREIAAVRA